MTDLHEFDLRYDNRVVAIHAFINTDRDHVELSKQIAKAAKGADLNACVMWLEGLHDGAEEWAAMCRERELADTPILRHGNRVLAYHAYVNTSRDVYDIHKAVLRIARGPRLDACVCWSEIYEGDEGLKVWDVIQKVVVKAHADPNSKPFTTK